ncbi:hypothetical protein RCZ01_08190 [Capnocytophaga felis]|uniref:DUF4836 domain-containing protein n=2 Tax=Capnocytophaga felis TaxID=2267611 RepID=A0A5M4B8I3_9FLAO|nr:hypothetical protein RCZ01_08190 [Capnocytophaga felis]GET47320.1 hypothetical protein RCZ02_01510 [Capnocytophaga felis]
MLKFLRNVNLTKKKCKFASVILIFSLMSREYLVNQLSENIIKILNSMKTLKKIKSLGLIFLGIVSLLLTSCSSTPEGLKTVPNNANFVGVIDVYSLYKKGDLQQVRNFEAFKMLQKEIRSESKNLSDFIDQILEDPTKTGINLKKDVFIYNVGNFQEGQAFCMSFELSSESDFSKFLQKILDETKMGLEIKKSEKYSYINYTTTTIAWDKDKALIVSDMRYGGQDESEKYVSKLMNLPASEQVSKDSSFKKFYQDKKDVSFWLGMENFQKQIGGASVLQEFGYDLTDSYLSLFLSFEDKHISLKTNFQPGKEYAKRLKEYNMYGKSFNKDLLNFLPKQTYMTSGVAINPQGFYKYLKDLKNFNFIEQQIDGNEFGFTLKEIFDGLGGSFLFSLSGFEKIKYTRERFWYEYENQDERQEELIEDERLFPIMGLVFDLNGSQVVEKILKISGNKIDKTEDYYYFLFDGKYPMYFTFNDKTFFITNSEKGIKSFKNGGLSSENLKETEIASQISKHSTYYYLNLNYDEYPELLRKELNFTQNANVSKVWIDILKEAEFKQVDNYSGELIIKFKKDGNSLNTILQGIDQTSSNFLKF